MVYPQQTLRPLQAAPQSYQPSPSVHVHPRRDTSVIFSQFINIHFVGLLGFTHRTEAHSYHVPAQSAHMLPRCDGPEQGEATSSSAPPCLETAMARRRYRTPLLLEGSKTDFNCTQHSRVHFHCQCRGIDQH